MEKIQSLFNEVFAPDAEKKLVKMIFGGKRRKSLEYNKVTVRPVEIGGQLMYQAEYTYDKKVTHSNMDAAAACVLAVRLVGEDFKQVNIFLDGEEIQVLASKAVKPHVQRKNAGAHAPAAPKNPGSLASASAR